MERDKVAELRAQLTALVITGCGDYPVCAQCGSERVHRRHHALQAVPKPTDGAYRPGYISVQPYCDDCKKPTLIGSAAELLRALGRRRDV